MNTPSAPNILRADYARPDYTVSQIDLDFDLDPRCTRVAARLVVHRLGRVDAALRLDGDGPRLIAVELDGQALEPVDWQLDAKGALHLPVESLARYLTPDPDTGEPKATFELRTVVEISPEQNTALSGLYVSGQSLFTQCEAEGFRRITFFPDRPDVMARYRVTLRALKTQYPVLLSNGNLIDQGTSAESGRHWASWEDPFPKPSYLFALVAGDLVVHEAHWQGRSGRNSLLQVWVEPGNLDKTEHAMESLQQAIRWDEETFGLELDLDRYMIVAVADFNMGAMENKGLNIFNTRYVFANPRMATDDDYFNVTSVVGHEYFHNWTGNRVTCRDWFQLTLKEGLTVFRDQEFSADLLAQTAPNAEWAASARAVQRIENVRFLRSHQFAEDAGPMAHPIRPDSYQEINNFYTVTVYEKGAEVIRMLQTIVGADGFRKGIELYFARHDGQAVTCDAFVAAIADANQRDLVQFGRWYGCAGTPRVIVTSTWDPLAQRFSLHFTQWLPAVPGRDAGSPNDPLHIPLAIGLVGPDGRDLIGTELIELTEIERTVHFDGIAVEPVPSLGRGFSAPIILNYAYSNEALAHLIAHDHDPFNRWEAAQRLAVAVIVEEIERPPNEAPRAALTILIDALEQVLQAETLAPDFKVQLLTLPAEAYLVEQLAVVDPVELRAARERVLAGLASRTRSHCARLWQKLAPREPYRPEPVSAGRRALHRLALTLSVVAGDAQAMAHASDLVRHADNLTDRLGALQALAHAPAAVREPAIEVFGQLLADEPLGLDKWFAYQALLHHQTGDLSVLERVKALTQHPAFSMRNPNRVRALIGSFSHSNLAEFHRTDGEGYRFWVQHVLELDAVNPQVAARLARALDRWRKFTPGLQKLMQQSLQSLAREAQSADVREIVQKALAETPYEPSA